MDNQINILKLFDKYGINGIFDNFHYFKKKIITDFIILYYKNSKKNNNNLNLLCNFINKDVVKYKSLFNKIIKSNIHINKKKYIIIRTFYNYNIININLLSINIYNLILNDCMILINNKNISKKKKYNIIENLLFYRIFNNKIIEEKNFNLSFFYKLFNKLIELNKNIVIEILFELLNFYNYRCKTYVEQNDEENILYILLNCVLNYYNFNSNSNNNSNIIEYLLKKNIDIINITYDNILKNRNDYINYFEEYIIFILYYKIINITIFINIEDIEYYESKLLYLNEKIENFKNDDLLLKNYKLIKEHIINQNNKNIILYTTIINNLKNKINDYLLDNIYNFYLKFINIIDNDNFENIENNESLSNIILNIIDIYLYKNYKYIFNNFEEKKKLIYFLLNLLMNNKSNININIKCIKLIDYLIKTDIILDKLDNEFLIKLFNNILLFYISLDNYEEEETRINIRNNIINILYLYLIYINKSLIFDLSLNLVFKFLIRLNEHKSIIIDNIFYYIENKYNKEKLEDIINIKNNILLNKYIFSKLDNKIDINIYYNIINKYNNNFKKVSNFIENKNLDIYNLNKLILNMIEYYNLLYNKNNLLIYIKNDLNFDIDLFKTRQKKIKDIFKNNILINNFENLLNQIEKINDNDIKYNNNINIPDDLLDPIYNTLIETPIILPSSKKIMDYNIIKQYLLYAELDPFNRDYLTIEMVDNYNILDDIKKQNSILKIKIEEWKKINNYI